MPEDMLHHIAGALANPEQAEILLSKALADAIIWQQQIDEAEVKEPPAEMNLWNACWYVIMATGPDTEMNKKYLQKAYLIVEREWGSEYEKINNDGSSNNVGIGISGLH